MVKRIGTIGGRNQPTRDERTLTKDGLVLGAIALVSVAFGVGLYEQMGLNIVLAVTLAAAGFFVLFSLHYIIVQLSSSESMAPRISSLERVVARLARDMSQVEDMSKEIAEFRSTCERIDQAHSQLELGGFGESVQVREEAMQKLSSDVRRLDGQIRSLRNYFDLSNQENKDRLKSELRAIETHVKNVSESVRLQAPDKFKDFSLGLPPSMPSEQGYQNHSPTQNQPPGSSFDHIPMPLFESSIINRQNVEEQPDDSLPGNFMNSLPSQGINEESEFEFKPLAPEPASTQQRNFDLQDDFQFTPQPLPGFGMNQGGGFAHSGHESTPNQNQPMNTANSYLPAAQPQTAPQPFFKEQSKPKDDHRLLEAIRQAIGANRMELFLQPIVSLPERNVAFYEALTRLKDEAGELIYPNQYLDIARRQGIMPVIDNVMLFRSIQVIRKLLERGSARGLFCNLSASSLMDLEFFPEFLGFMEKNKDLAGSLFFDINQDFYEKANKQDLDKLTALAQLGYRISMDNVTRLDLDYGQLQRNGVRFMKVDAHILLNGMEQAGARIHIADMQTYLKRYSIELIASKIETESVLTQLLAYNLQFGQGFLFSDPRPVRPEIFKKGSSQRAA
ncbi:MAG: EAL domain-containing protein [Methyloligellaceae bacterium]